MPWKKWRWYVYIIECKNNTYYTGMTWDVHNRYREHKLGIGANYTKKYGVKKLAYYEEIDDFEAAQLREIQLKNWSQEKKKKLINGEWD